MMGLKKNQIEQMMVKYEELQLGYNEMVHDAVSFLRAKNNGVDYHSEVWDFYVDVREHCWVVRRTELK